MDEKLRTPPINPLLLRIQASIASLRLNSYVNYNLLPKTSTQSNFRHRPSRSLFPYFVRRKWGRSIDPFEETPAITGHSSQSPPPPRPPPLFSTFTDNYPKQLAILIIPSSNKSINTYSKTIVDTWGAVAMNNKALSVDLWFATPDDTLRKYGWPNVPGFEDVRKIDKIKSKGKSKDGLTEQEEDTSKDFKSSKKVHEKDNLKEMMRELVEQTMVFEEPVELSHEQKSFRIVTKALHFLYSYHLDHYNYVLKITDQTFVNLPRLLELLSRTTRKPRLIGRPDTDFETNVKFCWKGPGYILSKDLLSIVGPHLPFCLEDKSITEDIAMERCLRNNAPTFIGCEDFTNGTGHEFLYLRPDDETNWANVAHPERQFSDGYLGGWTFADSVIVGGVTSVETLKDLQSWYGIGGKYEKRVERRMLLYKKKLLRGMNDNLRQGKF
ncbi:1978_t:CDS:2 [Scutellospora calospora]|uniref:1978_t:CDS:1 n=1 Tax=Scutellospora calospora TaxID=85575 RepID=A0ACA9LLG4_9GLOM|nr:1978_t:CDS:2 [Scutellospora calospora]